MKKTKQILLTLLTVFTLTFICPSIIPVVGINIVEAHSGRTDSNGGHRDNNNVSGLGSYHYHCGGYPAHLHSNGVCPYSGNSNNSDNPSSPNVQSEATINKKSATLIIGKNLNLKIKNTSNKIKWSSSNRSVASVSSNGKVTAKKAGKATITARVNGKNLTCKVVVKRQYPTINTVKWSGYGNSLYIKIKNPTKKPITVYPEVKAYDDDYRYFASMFLNKKKSITIPAGKAVTVCFVGSIKNFKTTDYIKDYYDMKYIYYWDDDSFDYKQAAFEDGAIFFSQRFVFYLKVNGEKIKCQAEYDDDCYPYSFNFK